MRASGAESQIPDRQRRIKGGNLPFGLGHAGEGGHGGGDVLRIQFADPGQGPVGPAQEGKGQPVPARDGLDVLLQEGIHLFHNQDPFRRFQPLQYVILRQGPQSTQTHQANPIPHVQPVNGLPGIEPAGAAGDDQILGDVRAFIMVKGRIAEFPADGVQLLKHRLMLVGNAGHPIPLANRPQGLRPIRQGAQGYVAPPVTDTGGEADDDHLAYPFGEFEGIGHHVLGLLHDSGLQHGDAGPFGLPAGVEFVGAGVGAGVVGGDDHQPALYAVLRAAEERVRRAEEAVLLHDADGPGSRQGGAHAGLQRAYFIGGPLGIKAPFLCDFAQHSQDLGGGRAGIGGGKVDTGLHSAPGNGLVALHQADLAGGVGCHCPFHFRKSPSLDKFLCVFWGYAIRHRTIL